MAKLDSGFKIRDIMGVNADYKQLIENAPWDLVDVKIKYEYDKAAHKTTDVAECVQWLLVGPRRGDKRIRNKQIEINSSNMMMPKELESLKNSDKLFHIELSNLDIISVWGKTEKNSDFAEILYKLSADVSVVLEDDDVEGAE